MLFSSSSCIKPFYLRSISKYIFLEHRYQISLAWIHFQLIFLSCACIKHLIREIIFKWYFHWVLVSDRYTMGFILTNIFINYLHHTVCQRDQFQMIFFENNCIRPLHLKINDIFTECLYQTTSPSDNFQMRFSLVSNHSTVGTVSDHSTIRSVWNIFTSNCFRPLHHGNYLKLYSHCVTIRSLHREIYLNCNFHRVPVSDQSTWFSLKLYFHWVPSSELSSLKLYFRRIHVSDPFNMRSFWNYI